MLSLLLLLSLSVVLCKVVDAVPYGVSGVLRLNEFTKISHDTYYLSRKRHPHKANHFVHGYAFLNLHRSALAHHTSTSAVGQPPTRRDKHHHFKRNLTTHESPASHIHGRQLYAGLPSCTGPISDGTAWRTSRGYYVHTKNRNGLTPAFIVDALQRANDAWHCGMHRFEKLVEGPLLGTIDSSSGATININEPDGANQIGFASIQGHVGTVAVTIVWGIFDGPLYQREIIEYDMLFDGDHYAWGNGALRSDVMDLQAIATHESGHSLGLDDIYDRQCDDVTMYGTSSEGETAKRSLESRDLQGLSLLYGPLAPN